ncbi:hypothetical protein [Halorientalis pallida]|uniref:Uncharacterized protein n=1 Tax=Halorientalis pallida TaxID=2479928 RepID=A0A498KV00_9EURY|nr:hypothetical protein [Halorientalis pallida]RXK48389.1 hypothetical protein EAF64_11965 [Halorientalis pallida]
MTYDPVALEGIGRRFWVGLGGTVSAAFAALVGGVWWFDIVGGLGVVMLLGLTLLFWAIAAIELALGNHLGATGQTITGLGWVVWGSSSITGFSTPSFWGGLVTILCGALVGLYADFGAAIRSVVRR